MARRPFLLMSATEANKLRKATEGQENRLDPIKVEAGEHKGKFALGVQNWANPAFDAFGAKFETFGITIIDTAEAWPQPEEPPID